MHQASLPSPSFVLDEKRLKNNLDLLSFIEKEADVRILLALKGFAMWSVFDLIKLNLEGAAASSLNEARLCNDEFGRKAHTYMVAYIPDQFEEIMKYSSHITFNSLSQFYRYKNQIRQFSQAVSIGLRVNPEYSDVAMPIWNPCANGSRLGAIVSHLNNELPPEINGLHFHCLCESTSHSLQNAISAFEMRFGKYFSQIEWVNFGGGHLLTDSRYDLNHLVVLLKEFKQRYPHLKLILEPGSAVVWDAGFLRTTILDIVENDGIKTVITDMSLSCHIPGSVERLFRPKIRGAHSEIRLNLPKYRIGGLSCLAGDYLDEYSFDLALEVGDEIIFEDMLHYTMVKSTMFNGIGHPAIYIKKEDGTLKLIRSFSYEDYKSRLS